MSYVVQNFHPLSRHIVMTPRFKYLTVFNSLNLIVMFFKKNLHLYFFNLNPYSKFDFFLVFYKYFFFRQYTKIFNSLNLKLSGPYTNNVTKSAVFFSLCFIEQQFLSYSFKPKQVKPHDNLVFNSYFLSIKLANIKLTKRFYKNAFFFFMMFSSHLWYQHSTSLKFYLNFFFTNPYFNVYTFYNGYFFRIYNF